MLPQNHNIDMIPQGVPIVVNVSQYDVGREINFYLYNGSEAYTPATGSTIRIEGTKPDNTGFSYSASYVGNKVTVQLTDQMTVLEGEVKCELRVTEGGSDVGSLNFILMVEKAALPSDIPISETEIPAIILLARAEQYNAEAWAVGTKNGQDVPSTDPAYHNNAKYYAEHMTASLESLSDTDITTPADKEVLKYNSNTDKWENSPENAESLSGLSDTSISSASNGQVLTYDNNSSKWKNANLPTTAMNDITDVSILSASDGQVLSYDALSSKWKNSAAPASDLSGLTDVTISSATNGQALLYDSTNSKWVNGDVAGSAADITYDNTTSGLTADDVQEAIDEVDGNLDTLSGKAYKTDDSTITAVASDDLLPIYDTSATAAKKITVANVVSGTVSNPNLADNAWFTVNQRELKKYTADGYTVDRWYTLNADVAVLDNGVTITKRSGAQYDPLLRQLIIPTKDLRGKTVLLLLYHASVVMSSDNKK